jgi:hypothetical protein
MAGQSSVEVFALEDIPTKIPLVDPRPADEYLVILYHSEAQFMLRKQLIEAAKRHWIQLDKLNLNAVLAHTA